MENELFNGTISTNVSPKAVIQITLVVLVTTSTYKVACAVAEPYLRKLDKKLRDRLKK
jgi:hypothetical protein